MSQSEQADKSFMAMLNNSVINPGPPTNTSSTKTENNSRLKPCDFPTVQQAKQLLTTATKDTYLQSESDEPFEWINTSTNDNRLPSTEKELVQLGLLYQETGEKFNVKTIQEFLCNDDYKDIVAAFEKIQKELACGDSKVYLIGEEAITVLILCIIQDEQSSKHAIIGLKSLLVQT
jgi:hypothetical protein